MGFLVLLSGVVSGTPSLMKARWEDVSNLSSVKIDRHLRVQKIVEKPKPEEAPSNIISMPIYVFNKAIFQFLPKVKPSPRGEYEFQDATPEKPKTLLSLVTRKCNRTLLVPSKFLSF